MNKYIKSFIFSFSIILVSNIFLTIFNFFDIVNTNANRILMPLIIVLAIFIGAYNLGKNTIQKGYLEGIKYGLAFIVLLFTITVVVADINISNLLTYILYLLGSIFGATLGINKKPIQEE